MGAPPLPIMPGPMGQPHATGVLAQSGSQSSIDPSGAITSFMNNYLTMKKATEQHYKSKFMEGVQLAAQGIPVDNEKLIKYAKKGGLDFLPTEPPTPEEVQAKQQQSQEANAAMMQQQAQQQQDPMGKLMMMNASQNLPQAPMGAQQTPGQGSPLGQWISQLSQAGQTGGGAAGQLGRQNSIKALTDHLQEKTIGFEGMSLDQKAQVLHMGENVIKQGPNYLQDQETLARMGVLKDMPLDDLVTTMKYEHPEMPVEAIKQNAASMHLYSMMGGPQLRLAQMTMAKDMLPFLNNDMSKAMGYIQDVFSKGGSEITPNMSAEQYKQVMEGVKTLTDAYPTAPMNLINATAHAQLTQNKELTGQLTNALSSYARSGSIEYQKHKETLGYDYASLAQKTQNEAGQLNLGIASELGKKNQELFENYFKLASNKDLDPTGDATRAAFDAMANSLNKDQQIKLNYRGQEIPIGAGDVDSLRNWRPTWPGGKPYLAPRQEPDSMLNQHIGTAPAAGPEIQSTTPKGQSVVQETSAQEKLQKYAAKVGTAPEGYEKVQAMQSMVNTLLTVPRSARMLIIQQLDMPASMKADLGEMVK